MVTPIIGISKYRRADESVDNSIKAPLLLFLPFEWSGLDRCLHVGLRVGRMTNKQVIP